MKEKSNTKNQDNEEILISKSHLKREAEALQTLGKEIYQLPKKQRDKLSLSNGLIAAFEEADRIKSNNALQRHFQYIGKLLREMGNTEEITKSISNIETNSQIHQRKTARINELITVLIQEDDNKTIEMLLQKNPKLNRQQLNQLIRNLRAEMKKQSNAQEEKEGNSAKKIKQYLRENIQQD